MRLLFIRHAESEENYFMESLATKYRDGLPQPFNFWDERKPAGPPLPDYPLHSWRLAAAAVPHTEPPPARRERPTVMLF
jgi:hypothetical protein